MQIMMGIREGGGRWAVKVKCVTSKIKESI